MTKKLQIRNVDLLFLFSPSRYVATLLSYLANRLPFDNCLLPGKESQRSMAATGSRQKVTVYLRDRTLVLIAHQRPGGNKTPAFEHKN